MRILLTGATGYIGQRLLPTLVEAGHQVICCVRDTQRFNPPSSLRSKIEILEVDFMAPDSLSKIPRDIQGAYYLIHSMTGGGDFEERELTCARNFRLAVMETELEHVIYLSGIVNDTTLSKHLSSRKAVELELSKGNFHLTTLRAGIIIGSGSASFEIIRDLAEKLPVMITPRWLKTRCQPIGIRDVIAFLHRSLFRPEVYDQSFDIAGPDILTYKEMLLGFAKARKLKRYIWVVPVMTPKLSSYWLYFLTSTSFRLASALVNSMKVEVVAEKNGLAELLGIQPIGYAEALQRTFRKIKQNQIVSSWKDALASGVIEARLTDFINVPTHGCFLDRRQMLYRDRKKTLDRLWRIGGRTGWYYATWLWRLRGFIDKLWGGVGLRRGRTHLDKLEVGDAVDFWRVLYANRAEGRLLLFAEMKLPGEAWLEFKIEGEHMWQTATFRPKGIWGRLYWYAVLPLHGFVFRGMLNGITV